jgi:hypothetical protein
MLSRILGFILCFVFALCIVGSATSPNLLSSTYFGGSRGDGGYTFPIVVSPDGDIFVAFRTDSSDFPMIGSPAQGEYANRGDILIARFSSDLTDLKALTYLGGTSEEGPWSSIDMVLDENSLVVVFASNSTNLPTTEDAFQSARGGDFDIGIARLSLNLSTIEACTYLGGSGAEGFVSVALSPQGDVVVSGSTLSRNFPRTDAYPEGFSGGRTNGDLFVSILDSRLTTLKTSRLLPGSSDDVPETLCIRANGDILLGGWTRSNNLANYEGSPDYLGGPYDGFVVQLDPDLAISKMVYVGGSDWDFVYSMACTSSQIAIAGHTASLDLPVSSGAVQSSYVGDGGANVGDDVFVTVLDNSLNVVSTTYLGGKGWENATALASIPTGWAVAGQTSSSDFAGTSFVPQGSNMYATEGFLAILDSRLTNTIIVPIGGDGIDCPGSLALNPDGELLLLMGTTSSDLPTTDGAWQAGNAGGSLRLEGITWSGDIWIGKYEIK